MPYVLLALGLFCVYEGIAALTQKYHKQPNIYDEARKDRVRRLGQMGDYE